MPTLHSDSFGDEISGATTFKIADMGGMHLGSDGLSKLSLPSYYNTVTIDILFKNDKKMYKILIFIFKKLITNNYKKLFNVF